jgi:hypothetical protein
MHDFMYVLLYALLFFPLQTIIHEWSHTLVPRACGGTASIKIFPGYVNGTWYWGLTNWNATMQEWQVGLTYLMPRIFDVLIVFLTWLLLFSGVPEIMVAPVKALQLASIIDFSYNSLRSFGYNPMSDAAMTRSYLFPRLPRWAHQTISVLLVITLVAIFWVTYEA